MGSGDLGTILHSSSTNISRAIPLQVFLAQDPPRVRVVRPWLPSA